METLGKNRQRLLDEFGIDSIEEPWDHQYEGVVASMPNDGYLFFYEAGTGKTFSTILAARAKMARDKQQYKVLVVCPLIVVDNWQKEWRRFSKINHNKIVPLTGNGKEREKTVKQGAQVFIASYESVSMPGVMKALQTWGPDILIVDEVHWVRNHKALRSKSVHTLAKQCTYRFGLSGTPVLNSMMDLFGQFLVIDLGETFGTNFFVFRGEYCFDKNAHMQSLKKFPLWLPKKGSDDLIQKKIAKISKTARKEECLSLPPLVVQDITFDLTGDQLRVYKELEKDFLSCIDDKAVSAPMALTKALRLQQISSGFVALEDIEGGKHVKKFVDHPRRKALKEILSEIAPYHKVIVWCIFAENYADVKAVADDLEFNWVELSGKVSAKEKVRSVDSFQNDPSVRILIGHPGSGGLGVNLQSASYSIVYSRSFQLEHELQSIARNHRAGSEIHEKITRINLIAKNTIDQVIAKRLSSKQDVSDKIIFDIAKELRGQKSDRDICDR